jgi:hypothetical protein
LIVAAEYLDRKLAGKLQQGLFGHVTRELLEPEHQLILETRQ